MAAFTEQGPIVFKIYELRQSVRKALDSKSDTASSGSGSVHARSTSSSKSYKTKRPHTRPCLLWQTSNKTCTLLLITTFSDTNPISNSDLADDFNLTKEELTKRLVAIDQAPSLTARPSIHYEVMPSENEVLDVNRNSYLVLIPLVIDMKSSWPTPSSARFYVSDLLYVNELLADLTKEMLYQQEIQLLNREIEYLKSNEKTDDDKAAIDEERRSIEEKREEAANANKEQRLLLMTLRERNDGEADENPAQNNDSSIDSSIPKPLNHSTLLLREEIQDDSSSFNDEDDESNVYSVREHHSNLAETIYLANIKEYLSFNASIEKWLYKIPMVVPLDEDQCENLDHDELNDCP